MFFCSDLPNHRVNQMLKISKPVAIISETAVGSLLLWLPLLSKQCKGKYYYIDYCNSVLAGLPAEQTSRLLRVQNSAARLVLKKRKRDHKL